MSRTEERLRRQFTAMEVTMAQLNSLGDYITQQMDAMAAANKKSNSSYSSRGAFGYSYS